ncbi:class I SAM-dependent methyltransferase [Halorussus halophilus]|uniref:hypothetical protein n=1 Tax=Halorussus halophilus TaxID=2650975 RepID=UPI001300DDCC|nr:hypothetical protein [Halorussus halophilus]
MTQTDPRRRVLDEFGAGDEIAGIDTDYTLSDLKAFIPAVALAFACLLAGVADGGLLAVLAGILSALGILAMTAVVIVITPSHLTPQEWVTQILRFKRAPKQRSIVGQIPDEQTEVLTGIARFDAESDAVERDDGTLVGGVRVDPANMALATDEEWQAAADALGQALNSLEFDIQIRSTARRVETDDLLAGYDTRLDDPDVRENEVLQELIKVYQRDLPHEFRTRGTSVREYQILIPVRIHEVQLAERGALARLETVSVIGPFLGLLGAESTRLTDEEIERAQHELLTERRRTIEDAIRGLESCTAEAVTAATLASWVEEAWTGRRTQYDSGRARERLRTRLVTTDDSTVEV